MGDIRTPTGDKIADDNKPIGLALSGSGLKASLFHIGVLARLAELDLLRQIDAISVTGGGAAIAALYYLHLKRALDTEGDVDTQRLIRLVASVERDFLAFAQTDLRARLFDNPFINLKRVANRQSSAIRLAALLERDLFRSAWNGDADRPIAMRELSIHPRGDRDFNPITDNKHRYCKAPWLIINAANLDTGRMWRFDAERMGEPAARPAARRLSKAPHFAQSAYRRLPEAYAGTTLGHAVAASMATPGLLEPLGLHDLYPNPECSSTFLDVQLGDGRLADALGTDVLLERGCRRLIVSDASGFETRWHGTSEGTEALQLAALEANYPGGVILIHMLREVEALEVKPIGPMQRGHVAADHDGEDATSYGVGRKLQKLIANMRVTLDAPSEIEAMSLMADGYLIAKRAFEQHRYSGMAWMDNLPLPLASWRFNVMFDALRTPSKKLIKNIKTSRLSSFKAPRLAWSEMFNIGLFALSGFLTLIALGASWSGIRPPADADSLWIMTTLGLLSLIAWLAGRHLGDSSKARRNTKPLNKVSRLVRKIEAVALALPLSIRSRFQHRASSAFLAAGQLKTIGIMPVRQAMPEKNIPTRRKPTAPIIEKKAA